MSDNPVDTNNIVSRACSMRESKVRLPCFGKVRSGAAPKPAEGMGQR
jgi:hypothetical protein